MQKSVEHPQKVVPFLSEQYSDLTVTPFRPQDIFNSSAIKILKTQNMISLLASTTANERTQKECKSIAELLKNEPYFSTIAKNHKALFEISSWIEYKYCDQNEYVYKVGDPADCFFIVVKGQITLSAPQEIVLQQEAQSIEKVPLSIERENTNENRYLTRSFTLQSPTGLKKQVSKRQSTHQELSITPILPAVPVKPKVQFQERIIRIVDAGESFGDLGQFYKRGTNAQAKEPAHLLIVRKQYLDYLAKVHLKSKGKIKYQFLSSLPFFSLLYRYSLQSLIYFLQEKKIAYNGIVFYENEPIKYIYVVYKGEFKLTKKIISRKQYCKEKPLETQSIKLPYKNISFRNVGPGEILGASESFEKEETFMATCVCRSQEGIVLKFEKNKFWKKVLAPDNNVEDIQAFLTQYSHKKINQNSSFVDRQINNETYVRYLHTPTARSRRTKTQSSSERQKVIRKDEFKRMSMSGQHFFNDLNKTVSHKPKVRRISLNRSMHFHGSQPERVPSSIKDIVQMVQHQSNYQKIRKPERNVTLFEFNITKVPLHVKKKFQFLFKKAKK